jgi:hypothetical protein
MAGSLNIIGEQTNMKIALLICTLLLVGCASPPSEPSEPNTQVVGAIADLHRRVSFLYELHRGREITAKNCEAFSGGKMKCQKVGKNCNCDFAPDGFGMPVKEKSLKTDIQDRTEQD